LRRPSSTRLTYSNVVSTVCLFVVLGGGAYAASQLPDHSVGTRQLKRDAVRGPQVANRSLHAVDIGGPVRAARRSGRAGDADRLGGVGAADYARDHEVTDFRLDGGGCFNAPVFCDSSQEVVVAGWTLWSDCSVYEQGNHAGYDLYLRRPAETPEAEFTYFHIRGEDGAVSTGTFAGEGKIGSWDGVYTSTGSGIGTVVIPEPDGSVSINYRYADCSATGTVVDPD
jgi:hypothetical protein